MKVLVTTFLLVLFTIQVCHAQQTITKDIEHDGAMRQYIIYIPAGYDASTPVPLLFNFHGFTQFARLYMSFADMRPVADTANFILVYPQGSLLNGIPHWNVGAWTQSSSTDDVGFTSAMIDEIAAEYNIDESRIYSCGYSNGGFFSFELACQLSDRIAAIGSVAANMTSNTRENCAPEHPIPVVTIAGTSDNIVQYGGNNLGGIISHPETLEYWVSHNDAEPNPIIMNLPDLDPSDGSTIEHLQYPDGKNCSTVEHYKVLGGGHDWPGSTGNMDVNAGQAIWNFVSSYDINGKIGCATSSTQTSGSNNYEIAIFPNPTNGTLFIEQSSREKQHYFLFEVTGQLVQSGDLAIGRNRINIDRLPPNFYILKVNDKTFKIVKTE